MDYFLIITNTLKIGFDQFQQSISIDWQLGHLFAIRSDTFVAHFICEIQNLFDPFHVWNWIHIEVASLSLTVFHFGVQPLEPYLFIYTEYA